MYLHSQSVKAEFDRDGYIVLRGFIDSAELFTLQNELDRYINQVVPTLPGADVMYEVKGDSTTLKQLARMRQHDRFFDALIKQPKWQRLAETLLGEAAIPQELEWFNKPAAIGKPTPPHQDGYYFMLEPNRAVTMWLALDHVDESNGCMRYIPGSHLTGMRPHGRTEVLGFSQGIVDFGAADRAAEIPIHAQPGDLLVHHSMTIHRATANASNRSRRSLGFVYYGKNARQDAQQLADYQEKLYKELETANKI